MPYSVLIASNDISTRGITAKFLNANGFICQCTGFDETLLSRVDEFKPNFLITGVTLSSRFYASTDFNAALELLIAAYFRCEGRMPVALIGTLAPDNARHKVLKAGVFDHFPYPLDLIQLLSAIRKKLRRISKLKRFRNSANHTPRSRGRPRKYPTAALAVEVSV